MSRAGKIRSFIASMRWQQFKSLGVPMLISVGLLQFMFIVPLIRSFGPRSDGLAAHRAGEGAVEQPRGSQFPVSLDAISVMRSEFNRESPRGKVNGKDRSDSYLINHKIFNDVNRSQSAYTSAAEKQCPEFLSDGLPVDKVASVNFRELSKTLAPPRFPSSIVVIQVPYEFGHLKFSRDDPRVSLNVRYARQRGYGFEICLWNDLKRLSIAMGPGYGHLTKPFCVMAAQLKYLGSQVQWILLLDSDAVFNPSYFDHDLSRAVSKAGYEDLTIVPGNPQYDGCTGVMMVRTNVQGLCLIQLWCAEVADNMYGLMDQNGFWSVLTRLWAHRNMSKGVKVSDCCRSQASMYPTVEKKLRNTRDIDLAWDSVQHKALQAADGSLSPVLALKDLAKLYGALRFHGERAGFVLHPAGSGELVVSDQEKVQRATGVSWILSRSFAPRFSPHRDLLMNINIHAKYGYGSVEVEKTLKLSAGPGSILTPTPFRDMCSLRCEAPPKCNFDPQEVRHGMCIFVSLSSSNSIWDNRNLDVFNAIQSQIQTKFILISHFSLAQAHVTRFANLMTEFESLHNYSHWFDSDFLVAWYSPHWGSGRTSWLPPRGQSLPLNFHPRSFGHCCQSQDNGKHSILFGPDSKRTFVKFSQVPSISEWYQERATQAVCEHQFVLCSGLPCVWEVMMFEGFPLITSELMRWAKGLESMPVLAVAKWSDVNVEMLNNSFDVFKRRSDWSIDKLFFSFWEDEIRYVSKSIVNFMSS